MGVAPGMRGGPLFTRILRGKFLDASHNSLQGFGVWQLGAELLEKLGQELLVLAWRDGIGFASGEAVGEGAFE